MLCPDLPQCNLPHAIVGGSECALTIITAAGVPCLLVCHSRRATIYPKSHPSTTLSMAIPGSSRRRQFQRSGRDQHRARSFKSTAHDHCSLWVAPRPHSCKSLQGAAGARGRRGCIGGVAAGNGQDASDQVSVGSS